MVDSSFVRSHEFTENILRVAILCSKRCIEMSFHVRFRTTVSNCGTHGVHHGFSYAIFRAGYCALAQLRCLQWAHFRLFNPRNKRVTLANLREVYQLKPY